MIIKKFRAAGTFYFFDNLYAFGYNWQDFLCPGGIKYNIYLKGVDEL